MKAAERVVRVVSREQARLYMVGQLKVKSNVFSSGGDGVEEILKDLRCIQVDSLDPMGLSHELVVMARTDGVDRGTMFRHLPDGSYFEHWAKERCILPASAFPYYHNNAQKKHMTHWWYRRGQEAKLAKLLVANITHESSSDDDDGSGDGSDAAAAATADERRLRRAMKKVIKEVKEKGPQIHPGHLTPINNERSTTGLALEVLWGECRVVITRSKGRDSKVKLYSTPDTIFAPEVVAQLGQPLADDEFARWAVLDRVEAAGLLPRTSGPHWSVFEKFRKAPIIDTLLDAGDIEEVQIEGSRTVYLAPKGWMDRQFPDFDDRMRLIAPLDPLVWHRPLVQHVFGFEYVWEVYKKEATRTWGWYVCPLLYKGRFVGRLEGKVEGDDLVIKNVWKEETPKKKLKKKKKKNTKKKKKMMKVNDGEEEEDEEDDDDDEEQEKEEEFNEEAFRAMLKRHAEACGASRVVVNGRKMTDGVPLVYSSLGGSGSGKSKTPQKTKKKTKPEKKKKAVTPTKRKRAGKAKLDEDEEEDEEEEASFDDDDEEEEDGEVELKRQKQGGGERRRSTRTTDVKRKKVAAMEDEEEEEEEDSGSDANDPSYGQ